MVVTVAISQALGDLDLVVKAFESTREPVKKSL